MRVWRRPADFAANGLSAALLSLAEQRAYQWLASASNVLPEPSGSGRKFR
jgi:hypothetical protein